MRSRSLLALSAAAALVLTACSGDDPAVDPSPEAVPDPTAAEAAELDEGVVAVVNDTEIPEDQLEARIATAEASPQIAALLEGENAEAVRSQLASSILSQLIMNEIVLDGVEERGIEIDDAAVEETRAELTEEAGGADAFEEQITEAGLDAGQLAAELEAITALRLLREDLLEESGAPDEAAGDEPAAATPTPSPGDVALQQWLLERLQGASVVVDPEIGAWDPSQGIVVPAGGPPAPAGGGGAPAPGTTQDDTGEPAPAPSSP